MSADATNTIEEIVSQLSDKESELYISAFRLFGNSALSVDLLRQELAGQLSGLELDLALLRLRKLGLLRAVKKTWGEEIYYIPGAHIPFLIERYLFPLLSQDSLPVTSTVDTVQEAKPDIAGEVLHLLSYIAVHGLPLTAKGTIHKKTIQKLEEMTVLKSSDFKGLKLSYSHPDLYPVQVAVMLDVLFSLGLVRKEEGQIAIEEIALNSWLELSAVQMRTHIYTLSIERYGAAEQGLHHFRYLLTCCGQHDTAWINLDLLCACLIKNGYAKQMSEEDLGMYSKEWAQMLAAFGYGDAGIATDGTHYFRFLERTVDEEGRHSELIHGGIFVQPDFEIMVPPDASYRIRWILEGCAELIARDYMTIYKLTKERIHQAAELGLHPAAIMEWLENCSSSEIPDNVKSTLLQWGGELGKTSLEAVIVLRCAEEKDADAIEAHPSYSRWGTEVERIGPRYFIIDKNKLPEVQKSLASMGLAPAKGIKGQDSEARIYPLTSIHSDIPASPVQFNAEGRQGFVYTGRNLHYYEMLSDTPEVSSLLPDYKSIPRTWHEEWREYHSSTAKQIVQQAISWRIKLGMEIEGARREFIPESIGRGEPWSVIGWFTPDQESKVAHRSTIVPAEWTNMSLILPN